jgi:hypothetical protein
VIAYGAALTQSVAFAAEIAPFAVVFLTALLRGQDCLFSAKFCAPGTLFTRYDEVRRNEWSDDGREVHGVCLKMVSDKGSCMQCRCVRTYLGDADIDRRCGGGGLLVDFSKAAAVLCIRAPFNLTVRREMCPVSHAK